MEYNERSYQIDDLLVKCKITPNILSELLGDKYIELKTHLGSDKVNVFSGIYCGILVSNPNVIFLTESAYSLPIFETNVSAYFFSEPYYWGFLAAKITGADKP